MGAARVIRNFSSHHLPIEAVEFQDALAKTLGIPKSAAADWERGFTIGFSFSFSASITTAKLICEPGLAISGGVDSMALAVLCSHLQSSSIQPGVANERLLLSQILPSKLRFRAFVVDHDMRLGSADEAVKVSGILEQRGIPTKILKIGWPWSQNLSITPNFESLARKYRFRLLGNACKDAGINSLLLAHHEDDQVETIMMRLVSGHRMAGLIGIKPKASIPECYGLYGVHESGGRDDLLMMTTNLNHDLRRPPKSAQGQHVLGYQPLPETGGIKIYRPLLGFSKERLISTCKAKGMPWFEDHTNKNPTITKRNSIRHMFHNYSLPTALAKPRLLSMARRVAERSEVESQLLKVWLAECKITSFDTGTGTLLASFLDIKEYTNSSMRPNRRTGQLAAELLARIIMLVSPEDNVELSSLHGAVAHIFPEMEVMHDTRKTPKAFTICGVLFRPVSSVPSVPDLPIQQKEQPKNLWFLSRQPYYSNSSKKPALHFPPTNGNWSSWKLYDGRYWLRIMNLGTRDVLVRPFHESDKKQLSISKLNENDSLQRMLKQRAPGNIRWTLPVISARSENDTESVLGLPTLGLGPAPEGIVRWEVKYKKVYTADMDIV